MSASGVNAPIMCIIAPIMRNSPIGIARIGVSRITGFYCTVFEFSFFASTNIRRLLVDDKYKICPC